MWSSHARLTRFDTTSADPCEVLISDRPEDDNMIESQACTLYSTLAVIVHFLDRLIFKYKLMQSEMRVELNDYV